MSGPPDPVEAPQGAATAIGDAPARVGRYRWIICALLFFATTINYVDRGVLGVLEPTLQKTIRWTATQYGDINAAFTAAYAIGFLKGKSAVRIHRELLHERRMTGLHFWATGSCVSTVGLDEARVRQYIREQEERDNRQGEFDFE